MVRHDDETTPAIEVLVSVGERTRAGVFRALYLRMPEREPQGLVLGEARFAVHNCESERNLKVKVRSLVRRKRSSRFVVVTEQGLGSLRCPHVLRAIATRRGHRLECIVVGRDSSLPTSDDSAFVNASRVELEIQSALLRAAGQAPSRHDGRRWVSSRFVRTTLCHDPDALRSCFELRHEVFTQEDYFAGETASIDIDAYDTRAVHVALVDETGSTLGCGRLILDRMPTVVRTHDGSAQPDRYFEQVGAGIRAIVASRADELDVARLKERIDSPGSFSPLPAFSTSNTDVLRALRGATCAELSRLVVDRQYRGYGLSRLLIWSLAELAAQFRVQQLVLVCSMRHEAMYARHGFRRLTSRPLIVEGLKPALRLMHMPLDAPAVTPVVSMPGALRLDVCRDTARSGPCACAQRYCWRHGAYPLLGDPHHCPLAAQEAAAE